MNQHSKFRVWASTLSRPYGPVMSTGTMSSGGMGDYHRLLDSISARVSSAIDGHSIYTAICYSPQSNAWAFRNAVGSDLHGIVVTSKLITRTQENCWAAMSAALQCLQSTKCPDDFLALWGDLPKDQQHARAFAILLVHVSMVLLMHHEAAHIVIGHRFAAATDDASESAHEERPSLPIDEQEAWGEPIPGSSIDIGWLLAKSEGGSHYRSQAHELDADNHALLWTQQYLESFDASSGNLNVATDYDRVVAKAMLEVERSRRFVLIAASWALFLALGGRSFNASDLASSTHPYTGIRLAMMLHAEFELAKSRDSNAKPMMSAAAFGALIGSSMFVGTPPPGQVAQMIGFNDAQSNWSKVVGHVNLLRDVRRGMQTKLASARLETRLPEINWWSTEH